MRGASSGILAALFCVLLPLGCTARDSRIIAVIPETTGTELWESVHAAAELEGRNAGYKIYWNAPTRPDDVAGQIALVERAIRSHASGIVLAPDHFLALLTVVREAEASHTPVAIIHAPLPLPENKDLSYIINDDSAMGRLVADRIGKILNGQGSIAIIGIDPNTMGSSERARSLESELRVHYPKIIIVERRSGSVNPATGQLSAAEVIRENSKLDALIALNSVSAQGSWAALNVLDPSHRIRLIGCDQEIDLMSGIRHGDIDSIVIENTFEMGRLAVRWISDRRKGREEPIRVKIEPILVTRANIDDPAIQRVLSRAWETSQ
jgi:ribose transport system substrate-binding protein